MTDNEISAGIFIFDDIQTMDLAAPLEVFDQADFTVFTVAKTKDTIKTSSGQPLIPKYDFSDHPRIDILVIPAGRDLDQPTDPEEIRWMRNIADKAKYILTVCCGSIEYAKAGLLGANSATTHHGYLDELKKHAPEANIISGRRWVDNGKLITSGGLCSGIDASLFLVSRIKGSAEAERIARWMEYSWTGNGIADY